MRSIDPNCVAELNEKYIRVSRNIDFQLMASTALVVVGTGASGQMIEAFCRLGLRTFHLFDLDIVESKNLVAQDFTNDDIGMLKTEALKKRLHACEFEKGNAKIPDLRVYTYGDFLEFSDKDVDRLVNAERVAGNRVIFLLASDFHPVQARGNRLALRYSCPTFFVGVYRDGKGGEIIFYDADRCPSGLACYRCITASRYRHWDGLHLANYVAGVPGNRAGRSAGLPMATMFIDAILSHLVVGAIHGDRLGNQHAELYRRALDERRNFIQTQLHPGTSMGGDDIFGEIRNDGIMTFNTLFQKVPVGRDCPDCHRENGRLMWQGTDYTRERISNAESLASGQR